jgi:hypothetical protein
MHLPAPNDHVRLTKAVPTLWLQCGAMGVIKSVWSSSPPFYEVEFETTGDSSAVRALIKADDLQITEVARSTAALHQE